MRRRMGEGPGRGALRRGAIGARHDQLPFVAENLGVITPEVEALRERFGLPGMAILQFAFGTDPQAPDFKPHNYPAKPCRLHGHARQRHDGGLVDGRCRAQHAIERRNRRRTRVCPPLSRSRRSRGALGVHPRGARVGRRHGDRSSAGSAGPGKRGAHESAGHDPRQLAMAPAARDSSRQTSRKGWA